MSLFTIQTIKKYRETAKDALILSFMFHQFLVIVSFLNILGKNSQIAHFRKICCNLPLFRKYVRIYHFLGTQIWWNWVFHGTQVYRTRVPWKNFKNFLWLEYYKKFSKFFRVYFFKELEGSFGSLFWATFWIFQTHLHTFLHTFSLTCISKTLK